MGSRERRLVFGEVADLYDRARPGYPDAAFDDVVTTAGLLPGDRVLEVGCGTGKATVGFVERGLAVVGVEPHDAMAAIARDRFARSPDVRIETASFEAWEPGPERFGLVAAAQAWHWVDPDVGFARAARCLGEDGWLGLMWNWPARYDEDLRADLDEAYERVVPGMTRQEVGRQEAPDWADAIASSGHFARPEVRDHPWTRSLDRDLYLDLLRTQSDHRLLDPGDLEALLDEVGDVVDRHGGTVVVDYLCRVFVARRL